MYVIMLGRAPSMSGRAGLVCFVHLLPVQYRKREGFGGSGYHPCGAIGGEGIGRLSSHPFAKVKSFGSGKGTEPAMPESAVAGRPHVSSR
jgi:hypothetical protein